MPVPRLAWKVHPACVDWVKPFDPLDYTTRAVRFAGPAAPVIRCKAGEARDSPNGGARPIPPDWTSARHGRT